MKHLKKFDPQQEKQTLLKEGIYVQPHVSWIAENDEVNYNNLDKTLVAPYGMHLTGDSHQYTVDSDGNVTGVTDLTIPVLINGEFNIIYSGYSGSQSQILLNSNLYKNKTITVYDLDLNEGWKIQSSGYIGSWQMGTYSEQKTLKYDYSSTIRNGWKRVLMGMDGRWYDLTYYTYDNGTLNYNGYVLSGDGDFDGYCFEGGLNKSNWNGWNYFKSRPNVWNDYGYSKPIWCYIEKEE